MIILASTPNRSCPGAAGLLAMRREGARTLGQNEDTCVVYGMPRVAFDLGAVEEQVPLPKIGIKILTATSSGK